MRVSAKSIIVELLSARPMDAESVPVKQLVRCASVFGVAENSVRVAIVRLRSEGIVDSPERGHYTLGPAAKALDAQVNAWRDAEAKLGEWQGAWLGAFSADLPRTDRPALRRRTRALKLLGFRELRPGLHIRPDNLRGGLESMREQLIELGFEREAPVFQIGQLSSADEGEARKLWPTERLQALYADIVDQLDESRESIDDLILEDAIREIYLLGREALRQIVLDPLLPEPLVPAADRAALFEAMRRYDATGRVLWRRFLAPQDH